MALLKLRYKCEDEAQRRVFISEIAYSNWSFSFNNKTNIVTILYNRMAAERHPSDYIQWSILDQYNLDKIEYLKSTTVKKSSVRF